MPSWNDYNKSRNSGTILTNLKEDGSVVVYLHTKTGIEGRLQHVVIYVDEDDKGKDVIRYMNYTCDEDYREFIKNRDYVPKKCPLCLFGYKIKNDNNIADNETVWEASIGSNRDRIITKEDYIGDGTWQNSFVPRQQCIFGIVDVEDLEAGLKVMIEPISVAETIGSEIRKLMKSEDDEGDPAVNPYPFKIEYNKKAKVPKDYYTAYRYKKLKLSKEDKERVEELLEEDALDLSRYLKSGNKKELIKIMERSIKLEDFDLSFIKEIAKVKDDEDDEDNDDDDEIEEKPKSSKKKSSKKDSSKKKDENKKVSKKKDKEPEEEIEDDEDDNDDNDDTEYEDVECSNCKGKGYVIKKKDGKKKKFKCKECKGKGTIQVEKIKDEDDEESNDDEEMSKCPDCEAVIPDSAEECPECGAEFEDDDDDEDDDDEDDDD